MSAGAIMTEAPKGYEPEGGVVCDGGSQDDRDRLLKQYTALDTRMGQLSSLSTYMSSQVAQWNKS